MYLNRIMKDYLTLTSFDQGLSPLFQLVKNGNLKEVVIRGYRGVITEDNVFYGFSRQKKNGVLREHQLLEIPGSLADIISPDLVSKDVDVTRCDVQLTIFENTMLSIFGVDLECMALLMLASEAKDWVGVKPHISVLENLTIYMGSRLSRLFRRIYRKEIEDGVRLVRFETEAKREYAEIAFRDPEGFYTRAFSKNWLKTMPLLMDKVSRETLVVKDKATLESRYLWIRNVVLPTLEKDVAKSDFPVDIRYVLESVYRSLLNREKR